MRLRDHRRRRSRGASAGVEGPITDDSLAAHRVRNTIADDSTWADVNATHGPITDDSLAAHRVRYAVADNSTRADVYTTHCTVANYGSKSLRGTRKDRGSKYHSPKASRRTEIHVLGPL